MSDDFPANFSRQFAAEDRGFATECWVWTGKTDHSGYPMYWTPRRRRWVLAHRWAFEHSVGPFDTDGDETLDHLCHTRACVRPDHIEAVSRSENSRRANEFRWHGVIHERGAAPDSPEEESITQGEEE